MGYRFLKTHLLESGGYTLPDLFLIYQPQMSVDVASCVNDIL